MGSAIAPPILSFFRKDGSYALFTLTAVQIPDMEEDLAKNSIVEEQKKKLQEAAKENGGETAFHSVFRQWLE